MNLKTKNLIDKLAKNKTLNKDELVYLIDSYDDEALDYISSKADFVRQKHYSNKIYIRGLIELSNICKNDCYYCGIRKSNNKCKRYRLSEEEIYSCCEEGYTLGFRTFVLQGGEDGHFTDELLCKIIRNIKSRYHDCAVTLSLGERSYESYKALKLSGADRYLLRHETANEEHYKKLHPASMLLSERKECLFNLKKLGYQVGSGFMVGSPYQTSKCIAEDLLFLKELNPQMVGIGPFIPHKDTPFAEFEQGELKLTLLLISIIRLMLENVLLPATTALATISKHGREMGIKHGANVIMPNLSPIDAREKYLLYNNKAYTCQESAQGINELKAQMKKIGFEIVTDRGDYKK